MLVGLLSACGDEKKDDPSKDLPSPSHSEASGQETPVKPSQNEAPSPKTPDKPNPSEPPSPKASDNPSQSRPQNPDAYIPPELPEGAIIEEEKTFEVDENGNPDDYRYSKRDELD